MRIWDQLTGLGFYTDDAQIQAARRTDGPFTGIGNVIFKRAPAAVAEEKPADDAPDAASDFL